MANQAIYCIVANRIKAEELIKSLVDFGVSSQDISFLSSQKEEWQDFSNSPEANKNWRTEDRVTNYPAGNLKHAHNDDFDTTGTSTLGTEKHTKAPEGATAGATAGGIIGGTIGLLAGIGALSIPGLGPFIAAGPIMATLSGIGVGGTLGGVVGALAGLGLTEYQAKLYKDRLESGNILIAVRAPSANTQAIEKIMKQYHAEDISTSATEVSSKNSK
jgi:hypothetical protein